LEVGSGWPQPSVLSISASQVSRIISVSHRCLIKVSHFCLDQFRV
jgi:hypothetical protein